MYIIFSYLFLCVVCLCFCSCVCIYVEVRCCSSGVNHLSFWDRVFPLVWLTTELGCLASELRGDITLLPQCWDSEHLLPHLTCLQEFWATATSYIGRVTWTANLSSQISQVLTSLRSGWPVGLGFGDGPLTLRGLFCKRKIPFLWVLLSWSNSLTEVLPPNTIILEVGYNIHIKILLLLCCDWMICGHEGGHTPYGEVRGQGCGISFCGNQLRWPGLQMSHWLLVQWIVSVEAQIVRPSVTLAPTLPLILFLPLLLISLLTW